MEEELSKATGVLTAELDERFCAVLTIGFMLFYHRTT